MYEIGTVITVKDRMQSDYSYEITAPMGEQFCRVERPKADFP